MIFPTDEIICFRGVGPNHQADNVHRFMGYPMSQKSHPSGEVSTKKFSIMPEMGSRCFWWVLKRIQETLGFYVGFCLKIRYTPIWKLFLLLKGKTCSSHARRSIKFWVIYHISQVFRRGSAHLLLSIANPKSSWRTCFVIFVTAIFRLFVGWSWLGANGPKFMTVTTSRRHWYGKSWEAIGSSESQSHKLSHRLLQDVAPKIAKLVYKWLNNGLW